MKKINLFPIYVLALLIAFSSCNSEDDVLDANLKTETDYIDNTETAFGKTDPQLCFENDGFKRWGWYNGPFTKDSFTDGFIRLNLYAGAGQCDYTKGEYVGYVRLYYNALTKSAFVRYYSFNGSWVFDETHFYIGSNRYPLMKNGKETVAPGHYPYKHSDLGGVTIDTFENVDVPEGEFYMIAHAVVSRE